MSTSSNFYWNNELIFELIDLFYQKPELWDITSEDFKDREKKQEAWREIGLAMNTDTEIVHKKMRNLMGQYRRELGRTKPASKWFAFKKLSFLKTSSLVRPIISSGYKKKPRDSAPTYFISVGPKQVDDQTNERDMQAEGQRKDQAIIKDISIDFPEPSHRERKKPFKENTSQEAYSTKKDKDRTTQHEEIQGKDEYATYGDLVAMKLRKISSSYARSTAQYHINNILYKAEIGAYDQHQSRKGHASYQNREHCNRAGSSSTPQRHDSNFDEHSQLSSSASKSTEDLLKLENDDSNE